MRARSGFSKGDGIGETVGEKYMRGTRNQGERKEEVYERKGKALFGRVRRDRSINVGERSNAA